MMRTTPVLLTTVALVAAAAACSSSGGSSTSSAFDPKTCQGGTLYVLNQADATAHHLDPARIYTSGGGGVTSMIFRTLTTRHRVPGQAGDEVVPDLATNTGEASDGAQDVDVPPQGRAEVRGRHAHHVQGHQVGRGASVRPGAARRHPLPARLAGGRRRLHGPVQGQGAGLDPDARRQDDRLQAAQARGRLPVRGDGDAVRAGAQGQGRRHRVREAPGLQRPVQGAVAPAGQEPRAGAQHVLVARGRRPAARLPGPRRGHLRAERRGDQPAAQLQRGQGRERDHHRHRACPPPSWPGSPAIPG